MAQQKSPPFRWSGEYCGFRYHGRLFDAQSNELGWVDAAGRAWRSDGTCLGALIEEHYLLRPPGEPGPAPPGPKAPLVPPVPPPPSRRRPPRVLSPGWRDALAEDRG